MASQNDPLRAFFVALPDQQRKNLRLVFEAFKQRNFLQGSMSLRELSIRSRLAVEEIEEAITALSLAYRTTRDENPISTGIAVLGRVPPRIDREGGEVYVKGLTFFPLEKFEKALGPGFYKSFDPETGMLRFDEVGVQLSKTTGSENNPTRLLKTLSKEPSRYWNVDEILEDWFGGGWEEETISQHACYDAALAVNKTVTLETGVSDFLEFTTKKVRINPTYLRG